MEADGHKMSEKAGHLPENQQLMKKTVSSESLTSKISHKRSRALRNKERRKRKRQQEAKTRDALLEEEAAQYVHPLTHQQQLKWEERQEKYEEECRERQRQLQHALWLERERLALERIAEKKRADEEFRIRREAEEKRIREEWEERLRKEKEEEEEINKKIKEKKDKQDALLKEATSGERPKDGGTWHNPLAPTNYGQGVENCQFFMKTGCCRFGDRCSRSHPYPDSGTTLLFRGLYSHFALLEGHQEEFDLDITLEYEDKETYHHFREFYMDVLPEFKTVGRVIQFKVCCNYEPHLRGNVYIQYKHEEDAQSAFVKFNGRWYAGRQLQCEFSVVNKWKQAICGQFKSKKCPKGKNCNFLHTFRNPGGEFWDADRDFDESEARSERHHSWADSERSHRSWLDARGGGRRVRAWDRARASQRRSRSISPLRNTRRSKRSRSRSPRSRSKRSSPKRYRSRSKSPSRSQRRSPSRSQRRSRSPSRGHRRSRSPSKGQRSMSQSPSRGQKYSKRSPSHSERSRSNRRQSTTSRSERRSMSRSPSPRSRRPRPKSRPGGSLCGSVRKSDSRSPSGERSDREEEKGRVGERWETDGESESSVDGQQSSVKTTENGSPSSTNQRSSKKKSKKKHKKHKKKKESNGLEIDSRAPRPAENNRDDVTQENTTNLEQSNNTSQTIH